MKSIFISIILLFNFQNIYAQTKPKQAIYYLIDTVKIPKNDRIISLNTTGRINYYSITIPCINRKYEPILYYSDTSKSTIIKNADIKTLPLNNINKLVEALCQTPADWFNRRYDVFLIEPCKKGYMMHKAQACHSGTICY